jgi:hypothetical protein
MAMENRLRVVGNDSGYWPDLHPPPEMEGGDPRKKLNPQVSAFLPTRISLWEGLSGKKEDLARYQRLMPVILAPWEAEIRRIELKARPQQIGLCETPSPKYAEQNELEVWLKHWNCFAGTKL